MATAEDAGVPVRALEPWDTVLKMFGDMTPAEEIDMIVYTSCRRAMPMITRSPWAMLTRARMSGRSGNSAASTPIAILNC